MRYHFENFDLDVERRELRQGAELIDLEPQAFDLLEYLVRNRERVVSKDDIIAAVWNGRAVSDSALTTRLNAVRVALRDSGEAQRLIKTYPRKGFRFIGPVAGREPANRKHGLKDLNVQFCRTSDGFNIAMASAGEGLPLIRATTWLNHIEYEWEDPIRSPLLHFLAERYHLIRYDGRGNGLSDRTISELSMETFLRDLEAVVATTKLTRYAMIGISQGAATAIAHAARYPEQVTKLVLYGSYARGRSKRSSTKDIETAEAYRTLMRHGWGDENSGFVRTFSALFVPNATPQDLKTFAKLQIMAASAENAVRLRAACDEIDVTDLLSQVTAPTLVMHARGDKSSPFEEGRQLAACIPNARFVGLESEDHMMRPDNPTWPQFTREIESFLAS